MSPGQSGPTRCPENGVVCDSPNYCADGTDCCKRWPDPAPSPTPKSEGPTLHPECRYYLARGIRPMAVELVDGCHGSPEGVAKAAKLHGAIFSDDGPWLMVELHPLPDADVPINGDDAELCRRLVSGEL